MAGTRSVAREVDPGAAARPPEKKADIDALMLKFFRQGSVEGGMEREAPSVAAIEQPAPPRRDFDTAADLLDRASQAFDLLINRCQILERDLDDANDRARVHAAEQDETIEQWKQLASGFKAQIEASDQAGAALKARCDAAEARATAAEQRVTALERASAQAAGQAAIAEQLSTKLHDKVVAAFGIGSRAHPVLEAVATKAAE